MRAEQKYKLIARKRPQNLGSRVLDWAMLKINPQWEEDSPGPIPSEVFDEFLQLIIRMSNYTSRPQGVLELFKRDFAASIGQTANRSSSVEWAISDLESSMRDAADNAALFIQAFCKGCESLRLADVDLPVPTADRINRILAKHGAGFGIEDDRLVDTANHRPVPVPPRSPSLDEQAQGIIQQAIAASDHSLIKGQGRQAVSELLWVLESVATAFDGSVTPVGTIKGKYFNEIVREMQAKTLSPHQNQILKAMVALHGYLSSPTGGGIRHGQDLQKGTPLSQNDARLYCDLIRSYITYMLGEHERFKRG